MNSWTLFLLDKMLSFTKTVSCLVIRTAQQIDTNLMRLCENFRQNLLVKSYFWRILIFWHMSWNIEKFYSEFCYGTKHRKSQTLPCALEAIVRKCLCFQIKRLFGSDRYGLIDEDHLGQVKFVRLFKGTVLNLHGIMMKPEIKLT